MSEHALKTAFSGNGSAAAAAATGTFPALVSGKFEPDDGNRLPAVASEAPDLEGLAEALNRASRNIGRDLRFKVDLDAGQAVLQVLDRETGELIRQIPEDKAEVSMNSNGSISVRLIDSKI